LAAENYNERAGRIADGGIARRNKGGIANGRCTGRCTRFFRGSRLSSFEIADEEIRESLSSIESHC
jgi:hypothetical protein